MAKWERGLKVREEGGLVEVTQAQEEWDRTGAQNEQVAHQQEGELTKRGFGPGRTEPGSMTGFTPLTVQFGIW